MKENERKMRQNEDTEGTPVQQVSREMNDKVRKGVNNQRKVKNMKNSVDNDEKMRDCERSGEENECIKEKGVQFNAKKETIRDSVDNVNNDGKMKEGVGNDRKMRESENSDGKQRCGSATSDRTEENSDQFLTTTSAKAKESTCTDRRQRGHDINANERPCDSSNSSRRGSRSKDVGRDLVPPDGGWGWMVAIGSFIITLLLPALGPCFGVLFSEYLLAEHTSSTTTAWIFNVQCFMWNVAGLVCRPLIAEFGWRNVGVSGSALTAFGLFISAFTPSPEFLFFSFSLLTGLGGGVVVAMCFTIIPQYFVRRRGVANAVMMAGICMGQILCPPFARILQGEFGQVGATMILGAICLHACIGASFFHPVEWHLKPAPDKDAEEADEAAEEEELFSKKDVKLDLNRGLICSNSNLSFADSAPGDLEPELQTIIARARLKRLDAVRGHSTSSYTSGLSSTLSISTPDVAGVGALSTQSYLAEGEERGRERQCSEEATEGKSTSCTLCHFLYRVATGIISDLQVLRSLRACILCLGGMLCVNGLLNFLMMVPFAVASAGLTLDTAALGISAYALTNLVMRMLSSVLSDFPWFRIRLCYMAGFLMMSAAMLAFTVLRSPALLLVTMAGFGCGVGCTMGLFNLVMIDVMGVERLAPVFGASCFTIGTGFISLGPFIGFIRDWSASYRVSIGFTSLMLLLSFLLWLLMPLAARHDLRRERQRAGCGEKP